ncbi:hypothetical protein [Streptosporangium roseum]|uniref:hypothetical protein n=1 Tax=Streptosporangium roseum TaxID=2001 RepID=UPI003323FB94
MTTILNSPTGLQSTGKHVKALFGAVLPHVAAEEDQRHPVALTKLHLEVSDGELRLIGTDRYTLAVVRWPLTAAVRSFATRFSVATGRISKIIADLEDDASVDMRIKKTKLIITAGETTWVVPGMTGAPIDPPWRRSLGKYLSPADVPVGRILIDPKFLARLESAKALLKPETPVAFHLRGENKPVIVTLGTVFLALVMPIRELGADKDLLPTRPLDGWFDLVDEEN